MKRRSFVKQLALTSLAAGSASKLFANAPVYKDKVGLQLYSLRDIIGKDPKKILSDVAAFGYKELETYGYGNGKLFGLSVAEYAAHVKSLGMSTVSGHYGIELVSNGWEKACDDAAAMGQKYVVVPYLENKFYQTLDVLKQTCATINKGAEVAAKRGLKMGYHNHAFEFGQVEGKVIMDAMLKELDPKLVSIELDLYWVVNAGKNPLDYFKKYPGRFEQWHVKDMDKSDRNKNADVGTGTIDFKSIFTKASESGMKHFYIEQETYPVSSSQSVKNSIQNLLKALC